MQNVLRRYARIADTPASGGWGISFLLLLDILTAVSWVADDFLVLPHSSVRDGNPAPKLYEHAHHHGEEDRRGRPEPRVQIVEHSEKHTAYKIRRREKKMVLSHTLRDLAATACENVLSRIQLGCCFRGIRHQIVERVGDAHPDAAQAAREARKAPRAAD